MSALLKLQPDPVHRLDPTLPPLGPSVEGWQAMSPKMREQFLDEVSAALSREAELSPETRPHFKSKGRAHEVLSNWFRRMGMEVYLGTEEIVQYPGVLGFCPDLFAVAGVPDPGEEADRGAWIVADEGRGIDFVLEVLYRGNRKKDLFDNVHFYASLGIPEYFVYDRRKQRLHGHRLPSALARRYETVPMFGGELYSQVLGLSLTILGEKLRFIAGGAELPETVDLLHRVNHALNQQEQRTLEETRRADEADRRADEADRRADEEAAGRRAEAQRADEEAAARKAVEARLAELLARQGES